MISLINHTFSSARDLSIEQDEQRKTEAKNAKMNSVLRLCLLDFSLFLRSSCSFFHLTND